MTFTRGLVGLFKKMVWFLCIEKVVILLEKNLGCARFAEIWLKYFEFHILWSLSSADFHTLTLQLPIQTQNSVAPELQVFVSSLAILAKRAHPWAKSYFNQFEYIVSWIKKSAILKALSYFNGSILRMKHLRWMNYTNSRSKNYYLKMYIKTGSRITKI